MSASSPGGSATELHINIGESANQAFSSGNTGPQRRVARMGHDHKTDAIFFRFVLRSVSESKIKLKNKVFV